MTDIAELERRAADGDTDAKDRVAMSYHYGWNGVEKNEAKAQEWYARADMCRGV